MAPVDKGEDLGLALVLLAVGSFAREASQRMVALVGFPFSPVHARDASAKAVCRIGHVQPGARQSLDLCAAGKDATHSWTMTSGPRGEGCCSVRRRDVPRLPSPVPSAKNFRRLGRSNVPSNCYTPFHHSSSRGCVCTDPASRSGLLRKCFAGRAKAAMTSLRDVS
jgi:hypothetical protein